VLRKFANKASNANAVYRQSKRYSCFTEESSVSIGLEFGVQSIMHNQKPDVYFINGHMGSTVLVSAFHIGV